MKFILFLFLFGSALFCINANAQIVNKSEQGNYTLSKEGASYFARLSLECTQKSFPHTGYDDMLSKRDVRNVWPAFYGCYDWHSAVHNHWALVKLLKNFPEIPEAQEIRNYLNQTFTSEKIKAECTYFMENRSKMSFEFPYGQCWLLKLTDELSRFDDVDAKIWIKNLQPLYQLCAKESLRYWSGKPETAISGSHDSPALGMSFALDYANTFKDEALKAVVTKTAVGAYGNMQNAPLLDEPIDYDFMSGSFLIADLMRKVYTPEQYAVWIKKFAPGLFSKKNVRLTLQIKSSDDHSGYESHWDGFHLNRIWCLNGILMTLPAQSLNATLKTEWITSMNAMWDYAQKSIGKGNYDIDHWLSSFSVFALEGYK